MTTRTSLMRGAALGGLIAITTGLAAQAETTTTTTRTTVTRHHRKVVRHAVEPAVGGSMADEVRQLREEVHALQARLDAQSSAQAQTRAQVQQVQAQAQAAQDQVQTAQAQAAQAAQQAQAEIQTIPAQVATAVAAVKPKTDGFYFRGVKITPGGFLEAASIYRTRNIAADLSSSYGAIPFANNRPGRSGEFRESARQSRLSFLAEGAVSSDIKLTYYGEYDFLAAAQTANSNESNSYTPRIRNMYGTIDWADEGWHFLAGQNWSLATMNSKGITPRNELPPATIEAQYVPGFVWSRQPQVRVTKDLFNKTVWLAVSAENPQTTFYTNGITGATGTAAASLPSTLSYNIPAGSNFNSVNTLSLNHIPDVIAKAAYEGDIQGHSVHLEAFGIFRAFYDRYGGADHNVYTGGAGLGLTVAVVPGLLDVQASGLTGRGIGRYGTAQLPDVTFRGDGQVEPISQTNFLLGATVHATKMLDIYGYAGSEHESRKIYGATFGYGNGNYDNVGCYAEGSSACVGNTQIMEQATIGFWQKLYQGPWGRLQFGAQYSYTQRDAFRGVGGSPIANDSMFFTSFRYYPF